MAPAAALIGRECTNEKGTHHRSVMVQHLTGIDY